MCSLLSSIHENNCFLFFKRYHMNIYPSATQKLPPTLWTISRASIARMSKSPRRGHIACEFWKIEDVAYIFSVYFMALWTFAYDHGYRNCDRAGSASTRWVGAVVQGPCGRRSWGEMVGLVSLVPGMRPAGRTKRDFVGKNDCHKKKKAMNYNDLMIFLESMMLWQRKSQLPYCWLSGKLWYLQYHCVGDTICYH